jgi:hypothetical protein
MEEELQEGFKYIVASIGDDLYQLFADAACLSHAGIKVRMHREGKLPENAKIMGGGLVRQLYTSETPSVIVLENGSIKFGKEPKEIREIFRPLLAAKLREMGIEAT